MTLEPSFDAKVGLEVLCCRDGWPGPKALQTVGKQDRTAETLQPIL